MRRIALAVAILALTVTAGAQSSAEQIDRAYQKRLSEAALWHGYGSPQTLAGETKALGNKLGITITYGTQRETKGDVTHLYGGLVMVWMNGAKVVADEAFINFVTSEIEFRGTVKMTAIPR